MTVTIGKKLTLEKFFDLPQTQRRNCSKNNAARRIQSLKLETDIGH